MNAESSIRVPISVAIFSEVVGGKPVLGNLGTTEATVTVAIAKSLTVRPLASPLAVTVFVVVCVIFDRHVNDYDSLLSSKLF